MNGWLRSLSYTCCVLLLVFLPACSDDDGGTAPTGGGGGGGGTTGDVPTDAAIEQGIEISNALMEMAPQWSTGNLVGPTKDATYNPNCQCWSWEVTVGDAHSNPFEYTTWQFQASFYAGETLVQNPQDADRATVTIQYIWDKGHYPEEEGKKDDESTTFIANLVVNVAPLGSDPVSLNGSGSAEFTSTGTTNGRFWEFYGEFVIDMNLSLALGGCPNGTMVISQGLNLFSIGYDGTSTAWWTYTTGEQGSSIRGSETITCSSD